MSTESKNPTVLQSRPWHRRQFLRTFAGASLAVGALGAGASGCNRPKKSSTPSGPKTHQFAECLSADRVFIPDVYHENANGQPNWQRLAKSEYPVFFGAILKVTQGSSDYDGVPWFLSNWPALQSAGGDRYGQTWFRGSYHYLVVAESGKSQAEYFLNTVDQAGGWGPGDLPPAVDVETSDNQGASKQQVIDTTSAWAETVKEALDCKVMLYGHTLMRNLGITSHMGCDFLWAPQYNDALTDNQDIGWPDDQVAFWQYTNGSDYFTPYPTFAPGIGPIDMSLFMPFKSAHESGNPTDLRDFVHKYGPGKGSDKSS